MGTKPSAGKRTQPKSRLNNPLIKRHAITQRKTAPINTNGPGVILALFLLEGYSYENIRTGQWLQRQRHTD
jgi:hypothetical protein